MTAVPVPDIDKCSSYLLLIFGSGTTVGILETFVMQSVSGSFSLSAQ